MGLAQAILHDPPVLILDEPTSGLDPAQVAGIRDLIRSLAGDHTVILSTHILSEVEAICPRALIIAKGKLRAQGTLAELRAHAEDGIWYELEIAGIDAKGVGSWPEVRLVEPLASLDGFARFRLRADTDPRTAIARRAAALGLDLRALDIRLPTLEQAFIDIVGRE